MHDDSWHDGMWGDGSWWWMTVVMIVVVVAVVWVTMLVARQSGQGASPHQVGSISAAQARPTAQGILAERLARGEIEPEAYRSRLAALTAAPR